MLPSRHVGVERQNTGHKEDPCCRLPQRAWKDKCVEESSLLQRFKSQNGIRLLNNIGHESTVLK